MKAERIEGWTELLADWVHTVRDRPFRWGEWDCVLAAADCAHAITGANPLGGLMWADVKGALRQLEVMGGLEAATTSLLGEPIPPAFAQRGDVVLVHNQGVEKAEREIIAVCLGECACAPMSTGLAFIDMRHAITAWKVGRG